MRAPERDDDEDENRRNRRAPENEQRRTPPDLAPGYYNEFTAALAGVSRESPEQETLQQEADERLITTLSVEGELQSQDRFDRAASFLGGFSPGQDGDGGSLL